MYAAFVVYGLKVLYITSIATFSLQFFHAFKELLIVLH